MSPRNEVEWLRHLLPLPHEIAFEGTVMCPPGAVAVRLLDGAGSVEEQEALELRRLMAEIAQQEEALRTLYEHWDEATELNW